MIGIVFARKDTLNLIMYVLNVKLIIVWNAHLRVFALKFEFFFIFYLLMISVNRCMY